MAGDETQRVDQGRERRPTDPRVRRSRLAALLALPVLLTLTHSAPADPPFFEPTEGFFKARGREVATEWVVDRKSVPEDGVLTATLVVRGATNPHEIVRPDLRKLPEFARRFEVTDVPGQPAAPNAKEVSFVYRLRPRNREVNRLPSMDFFYLNPAVPSGKPFQNARVKGKDITVTAAAPRPKPQPIPLDAPDALFVVTAGPGVLGPKPYAPTAAWLALAVAAPLVACVWYLAWGRLYPNAVRMARIRRGRAVRRVQAAVRAAHRSVDPAEAIASAVLDYLRSRFPLPAGADTPAETGDRLRAAGLSDADVEGVVQFFRRCDAARFAPEGDSGVSLVAAAEGLVGRLEEVE